MSHENDVPVWSPSLQQLIDMAREKTGFIDPATMGAGGGGGMPPGMPPGDPAAAGGGGAPPPPDPAAGGGGGGADPLQMILEKLNQLSAGGGAGAGGAAGGGALKPKVDTNVVLLQILKIVTRMAESQGVEIPPSDMVPTMTGVNELAQMSQTGNFQGASSVPTGAGGQGQSAIPPIEPMQAAAPGMGGGKQSSWQDGVAFGPKTDVARTMNGLSSQAAAVAAILSSRRDAA